MKVKIKKEGQPCRKCGTPVVKKVPTRKALKEGQRYFYNWYLFCEKCKILYMVEEQKVEVRTNNLLEL